MSDEMKTCGHCHFNCPLFASICGHCHAEFRTVEVEKSFSDRFSSAAYGAIAGVIIFLLIDWATAKFFGWNLGRFEWLGFVFAIGGFLEGFSEDKIISERTFR